MFRRSKSYESGFDQESYDKASRKLGNLSRRDLLYQLDQYLTEVNLNAQACQHNPKFEVMMDMKRNITVLMAIVDEIYEDYSSREESMRLLPY